MLLISHLVNTCKEKRIFYRLISGLQTSISIQLCYHYLLSGESPLYFDFPFNFSFHPLRVYSPSRLQPPLSISTSPFSLLPISTSTSPFILLYISTFLSTLLSISASTSPFIRFRFILHLDFNLLSISTCFQLSFPSRFRPLLWNPLHFIFKTLHLRSQVIRFVWSLEEPALGKIGPSSIL